MEENKKSNKGLITIIVIIVLLITIVGFLALYKDWLNKNNNEITTEKTTIISTTTKVIIIDKEELDSNDLSCDGNEKCDIAKIGKFKISIQNDEMGIPVLYINDELCKPFSKSELYGIDKFILLDDDYAYVAFYDMVEGSNSEHFIIDSKGNVIQKLNNEIWSTGSKFNTIFINYDKTKNIFNVSATYFMIDSKVNPCFKDKDEVFEIKGEIKYIGKGKIDKINIIESKTSDEVIRERYNMSCEEIKNSTSKELENEREVLKINDNN